MYHHVSPCITIVFNLAAPLLEYSAGFAVMRTTSLEATPKRQLGRTTQDIESKRDLFCPFLVI